MEVTRRLFIGMAGAAILGSAALTLSACGAPRGAEQPSGAGATAGASAEPTGSTGVASEGPSPATVPAGTDAIVVYFSRAGENYGVGYVEEGNTAVVAKMVAEATGAGMFEVAPAKAYPEGYDECCNVALAEKNGGARPAIAKDVDIAPYKTVYLGYPIWWGDVPMCVYTFLETHDWTGKTIRPFCTHAGSGLAGTAGSVASACPGADVAQGLAITGTTAQNSRDQAREEVRGWLA
ncbi:MAG: hypothetical protein J6D54_12615 [Olsenella sp.]|nr:hypothetical protein [Olsenella sp.]